jgi:uncharacterized protein (TIGR03437 family)
MNENPLPVISSDASSVTVQIPWEMRTGATLVRVDFDSRSPFAAMQDVFISPATPRFASGDPAANAVLRALKIVRGDFSGPLTAQPGPGEIVHLYMTGLGPVRGLVQTGVPAPVDDLRPIVGTITCRFLPQSSDAETLFAGLAPGFVGAYQVTFRMPADAGTAPLTGLHCDFRSEAVHSSTTYTQIPLP